MALNLGVRLGLSTEQLSDVSYVALLCFRGCTADAHDFAEIVGADDVAPCALRSRWCRSAR